MSRILDAIGPDARATVLVEVTDAEDGGYPLPGNHDVRWLHRGAQPATRSLLEEAVRGLTLPDGPGLLWFSGRSEERRVGKEGEARWWLERYRYNIASQGP